MKRVKILRGEWKGHWGIVMESSRRAHTVTILLDETDVLHVVNQDWVMVINSNNAEPKSRLFGG